MADNLARRLDEDKIGEQDGTVEYIHGDHRGHDVILPMVGAPELRLSEWWEHERVAFVDPVLGSSEADGPSVQSAFIVRGLGEVRVTQGRTRYAAGEEYRQLRRDEPAEVVIQYGFTDSCGRIHNAMAPLTLTRTNAGLNVAIAAPAAADEAARSGPEAPNPAASDAAVSGASAAERTVAAPQSDQGAGHPAAGTDIAEREIGAADDEGDLGTLGDIRSGPRYGSGWIFSQAFNLLSLALVSAMMWAFIFAPALFPEGATARAPWEFVISVTSFSILALLFPTLLIAPLCEQNRRLADQLAQRAAAENHRAETPAKPMSDTPAATPPHMSDTPAATPPHMMSGVRIAPEGGML